MGGYANDAGNCIRGMSNAILESVPQDSTQVSLTDTSIVQSNGQLKLQFTRPNAAGQNAIVKDGNFIITAVGSTSTVPTNCETELTWDNKHNMHNFVLSGTKFGILSGASK